jgi:hypothetical protein
MKRDLQRGHEFSVFDHCSIHTKQKGWAQSLNLPWTVILSKQMPQLNSSLLRVKTL